MYYTVIQYNTYLFMWCLRLFILLHKSLCEKSRELEGLRSRTVHKCTVFMAFVLEWMLQAYKHSLYIICCYRLQRYSQTYTIWLMKWHEKLKMCNRWTKILPTWKTYRSKLLYIDLKLLYYQYVSKAPYRHRQLYITDLMTFSGANNLPWWQIKLPTAI